jgi:hypothetical protein
MAGAMTVMVVMASGASRTNVLKGVKLIVVTMTSALVVGRSGKEGCIERWFRYKYQQSDTRPHL